MAVNSGLAMPASGAKMPAGKRSFALLLLNSAESQKKASDRPQVAGLLGGKQTFNNRVRGNRLLAHVQDLPQYRPPRFENSCKMTFARMITLRCAISE